MTILDDGGMMRHFLRRLRSDRASALGGALRRVPVIVWRADARLSSALVAVQIVQIAIPLGQLWIAKLIIDRVVSALAGHDPGAGEHAILALIAVELGLGIVGLILREILNVQRQVLAERLAAYVSTNILEHAQRLDLSTLERPDYHDRLRRAEEAAFYRPASLLFQSLAVMQAVATLAATAVLLVRLQPLMLPVLAATALPYALVQSGAAARFYTLSMGQTARTRLARYFSELLSTDAAAREIRVFGLADYLLDRYRRILAGHQQEIAALAWRRGARSAAAALLPTVAYAGFFAYLAVAALDRHITVGDLTLYIGLILRSQDALQGLMVNAANIIENGLFLDDYRAFLALEPVTCADGDSVGEPVQVTRGISFEGVSYRYAGSTSDALHEVSLDLRMGETVAIVGPNGAGKTTLVKLLARLYDPTEGIVTVDGRDLRSVDAADWRNGIAVIFQDFVRYHLSAAENIGFGQIDALHDRSRIVAAGHASGADEVIAELPDGYGTLLGRRFDAGVQLSGGEWQRIALARAFMRDAPILVLDEPTASLDARTEYEVFRRLRDLGRGRIVLLISHRFSTVRMADRIYVLDAGRVVECGSHDELLRRDGQYAELFHLQAAGYR